MSTNALNTIVRELKELRLMAEQLDAEIKNLEDAIKAYMTVQDVDTLITTDIKIAWKAVTSSRIDTTALKKQRPDVAAIFTKETTSRRFTVDQFDCPLFRLTNANRRRGKFIWQHQSGRSIHRDGGVAASK